jgi:hypothetical protein
LPNAGIEIAPSVCRLVPESTICATFVAPGSLIAQAPALKAPGKEGKKP